MDGLSIIFIAIYFLESIWELRLYTRLGQVAASGTARGEEERIQKVLKLERRWNLVSWVIIIAAILVPDDGFFPLACLLVLLETIVIMQLDRVDRRVQN